MVSYHIFFNPRSGVPETHLVDCCKAFLEDLRTKGKIAGHRILITTNSGNFSAMPKFHVIVDYDSQVQLDDSFAHMHTPGKMTEGHHGALVTMVENFMVTFTRDAN